MSRLLTSQLRHQAFPIVAALFVLPLIYFSGVRFISQLIVPTDISSLWETPLQPSPSTSPSTLSALAHLDPFTADYPYLMALRFSGEDTVEALRLNKKAISLSILSPRYWVQQGWLEAQRGHVREALRSFEKAIFLDPVDVDAHVQKGLFLFFHVATNGEPQRKAAYLTMAEQSLALAASYDPSLVRSPSVGFALASIYFEKGRLDEARKILRDLDDTASLEPRFLVRKWTLQFRIGDTTKPISQWEQLFRGGKLSQTDLTTLADEMVKHAIPDFSYFVAQILQQRGETESALQKLKSCVSERPNVAEYRLALGDAYEKLGKPEDALAQYEAALKLSPANQYAKAKMIEYYRRR